MDKKNFTMHLICHQPMLHYHLGCPARHCGVLAASEDVFYWWKNPLFRKATEVLRSKLVKRFE